MEKIRKGDHVVVLSGRDKGRRGAVLQVLRGHVVVESINRVKRHTKANPQANQQGGLIDRRGAFVSQSMGVVLVLPRGVELMRLPIILALACLVSSAACAETVIRPVIYDYDLQILV